MARYTNEMRERAVRMVAEVRPEHPHKTAALRHVAGQARRIRELEQENRELRRANEILKRAASFFGAELDRQHKK